VNTAPITMTVGRNHTIGEVVAWVQTHGYPDFTWSDFWEYNPDIITKGIEHLDNGDWRFTAWSTTVTIAKPDAYQSGTIGNTI